jgi:hypothetical protein
MHSVALIGSLAHFPSSQMRHSDCPKLLLNPAGQNAHERFAVMNSPSGHFVQYVAPVGFADFSSSSQRSQEVLPGSFEYVLISHSMQLLRSEFPDVFEYVPAEQGKQSPSLVIPFWFDHFPAEQPLH